MGTLASTIANVRIRIRESKTHYFSDDDFIVLANDTLVLIFDQLAGIECKLALTEMTFVVTEAVASYPLSGLVSIAPALVYLDKAEVPVYNPLISDVISYKETTSGIDFFNHKGATAVVSYWGPLPVLTAVGDTLPWEGIWDAAIMRSMVVEANEIRSRKNNNAAALASIAFNHALSLSVVKKGTIPRTIKGTL